MTFTIITATYNSGRTIAGCLESVRMQTHAAVSQVIIDGRSADDTLDIIRSVPNRVALVISEPDKGIYDAMNKGIGLAKGEVVGFLHSDDVYADDEVIREVDELMTRTGADALYADLYYFRQDKPDRIFRYWKAGDFVPGSFARGWHLPHPTFFLRSDVYRRYGLYDTTFTIAADFELTLRVFEKYRISTCYLARPIVKMQHGGVSTGTLKNILLGNLECYRAFGRNGIPVSPLYLLYRSLPKALEFWRRGEIN